MRALRVPREDSSANDDPKILNARIVFLFGMIRMYLSKDTLARTGPGACQISRSFSRAFESMVCVKANILNFCAIDTGLF